MRVHGHACSRVRVCVCACVRVCVCACVRVWCVCACVSVERDRWEAAWGRKGRNRERARKGDHLSCVPLFPPSRALA